MKTIAKISLAAAIGSISSQALCLEDITFVASAAFQNKQLSFDQRYSGVGLADNNSAEFDANIPMLNLSFTAVRDRFFVALKLEKSLAATSTGTTESDRSMVVDGSGDPSPEANLLTHPGGSIDVKREDYSFTFGYNVWKRLNLFTGYIFGETVLNPQPFCANPFPPSSTDPNPVGVQYIRCSRSNRAFTQFYIGDRPAGATADPFYYVENQAEYEHVYTESGFFFGGSYSFKIAEAGTLAVSLAYASLDGQYKDNAFDPNAGFGGEFFAFDFQGKTSGTSLAITWTGSLGPRAAYTIDLRRQAYSLDGTDRTGNLRLADLTLDTDEEMLGITTGVQFYF